MTCHFVVNMQLSKNKRSFIRSEMVSLQQRNRDMKLTNADWTSHTHTHTHVASICEHWTYANKTHTPFDIYATGVTSVNYIPLMHGRLQCVNSLCSTKFVKYLFAISDSGDTSTSILLLCCNSKNLFDIWLTNMMSHFIDCSLFILH